MEEILDAAFALKSNTAAGCDYILSRDIIELLDTSKESEKWKSVELLKFLHKMMQRLWKVEKVPKKFKQILIRPFIKDADKDSTKPSNYRPVALLNVIMKLYEHIIKERLVEYLERNNYLSSTQAAYRKRRSTVDNILVLQEVFYYYRYKKGNERKMKNKLALYFAFMDLTKAFDTVPRQKLYIKLR